MSFNFGGRLRNWNGVVMVFLKLFLEESGGWDMEICWMVLVFWWSWCWDNRDVVFCGRDCSI